MKRLSIIIVLLLTNTIYSQDFIEYKKTFKKSVITEMFKLVNKHRINPGSHPLIIDTTLFTFCLNHSKYIAFEGISTHFQENTQNPHYTGYSPVDRTDSYCGENCGFTSVVYLTTPYDIANEIFEIYKGSPDHNKNMLDTDYKYFGFDFVVTKNEAIYGTQIFKF